MIDSTIILRKHTLRLATAAACCHSLSHLGCFCDARTSTSNPAAVKATEWKDADEMDGLSWQPIAPTRRGGGHTPAAASLSSYNGGFSQPPLQPQQQQQHRASSSVTNTATPAAQVAASASAYNTPIAQPKLTGLPPAILIRILSYLPIADLAAAAQAHSKLAAAHSEAALWTTRLNALAWAQVSFWDARVAELMLSSSAGAASNSQTGPSSATTAAPAATVIEEEDDDGFGDFEEAASTPVASTAGSTSAPKSFFDVDFSPVKVPTVSGGTQVVFSSTPFRRIPSPDRHEAYRKVRAYTTLLRPLAKYLLQSIPEEYIQRRVRAGPPAKEVSLIGDDISRTPNGVVGNDSMGAGEDDDEEDEGSTNLENGSAFPLELSPTLLWTHPSLPESSTLSWIDQTALLSNLIRFLSPTSAHLFLGLRTPPPVFAWKYEGGIWPWPSSASEMAELLSRLAVQARIGGDAKNKRSSFAGIWRATENARHESRGYELPSRRGGSPPPPPPPSSAPGTIAEEGSPQLGGGPSPLANVEKHLRRAHELHILTRLALAHATALEQSVLLPVFEGAGARKRDAERAAGLMLGESSVVPTSPGIETSAARKAGLVGSLGSGATADAVRRAEETMASAARAAWSLRRAFIIRDPFEEDVKDEVTAKGSGKGKGMKAVRREEDDGPIEELTPEQQLFGRHVSAGMLCRPSGSSRLAAEATGATLPNPQTSPGDASTSSATAAPSTEYDFTLPPPKLVRPVVVELTALGQRLFQTYLSTLPILQRTSTLRRSHDPRSNIISFALPPLPSSAAQQYSQGADLDFGPMADAFIPALVDTLRESLRMVRRLFPVGEGQDVDVALLKAVTEVVLMGEYVDGLMAQIAGLEKGTGAAGGVGSALGRWVEDVQGKPPLSLRALPAAFAQAMRLPAVLVEEDEAGSLDAAAASATSTVESKTKSDSANLEKSRARLRAEDVIFLAFEPRMDAYLAHEREWVQRGMDRICASWNRSGGGVGGHQTQQQPQLESSGNDAFLAAANPVAAKKSLLTSFKDVLLVPVSVVPRTATFVGGAVVSTFASATSSRRKDAGAGLEAGAGLPSPGIGASAGKNSPRPPESGSGLDAVGGSGYMDFSKGGDGPFGIGDDDDEDDDNESEHNHVQTQKDRDQGDAFGSFPSASVTNPFAAAAPEVDEWATADHAFRPSALAVPGVTSVTAVSGGESDEGWGDFASSSSPSVSAMSASSSSGAQSPMTTRPTSLATTAGRSSVLSSSASPAQLAPPLSFGDGRANSGRSTPIPAHLVAGSGRSTPQPTGRSSTPVPKDTNRTALSRLQLLLSLDVALELIHLNRDTLKRIETFRGFPGAYGMRIRQEVEGIAVVFLQTLSEKHLTPGLKEATEQVKAWIPAEHDSSSSSKAKKSRSDAIAHARMGAGDAGDNESEAVEPLVHFFELVHVGDAIQQMVQLYFDQELSRHVDRTDFLNVVVREKKRFERQLDECVAQGLNAGVDGLMGQVDYLMSTRQGPRDYYPEKPEHMDLGNPTQACQDVVRCLRTHCSMLVGSTDKSVLEVFYQEVGLRLYALICKHLKRQIISIDGGFKVIADLNAYFAFVASFLRQSQVITYFEALKMLGNIYIIDHPRELAQIVRDANMFGGLMSPEELYEFLQARADFKSIEKAVDKEMYGFKVAEDCVIC